MKSEKTTAGAAEAGRSSHEERGLKFEFSDALMHTRTCRSSHEERLPSIRRTGGYSIFQSTLLMRGATRACVGIQSHNLISIHAPHARSDRVGPAKNPQGLRFQSTLLMRGATLRQYLSATLRQISIHAPHARSDVEILLGGRLADLISIHAPHARSDTSTTSIRRGRRDFNPRSSCEERPDLRDNRATLPYFNPRSSCEERQGLGSASCTAAEFQSTLLMRGATEEAWLCPHKSGFQSTLLMRGATIFLLTILGSSQHFNPRSSCEERLYRLAVLVVDRSNFNPRSSCEERLQVEPVSR